MAKLHDGMLCHGTALLALEQTKGKGQRGKEWLTAPGQNITMSTAISLKSALPAADLAKWRQFPFLLSVCTALSCYDFIKAAGVDNVSIKWPNDLYIDDRKAGGILIENILRSGNWEWAVIGTGINVNQQYFPALTKATSLGLATGKSFEVINTARILHGYLLHPFTGSWDLSSEALLERYNGLLYKKDQQIKLRKDNIVFATTLREVTADGQLVTADSLERRFSVGEVEFV